jgi:hypothetical protein
MLYIQYIVEERDMDTVVAIHNNMNENTWMQLLAWEKLHPVIPCTVIIGM